MKVVIQRVSQASVTIDSKVTEEIDHGLLVLLGIHEEDQIEDVNWLCKKISQLRIFNDEDGNMNLALPNVNGDVLLISQFTLQAKTKKGNRPSFIQAAKPEKAIPLYEKFIQTLSDLLGKKIATGEFGADMKIALVNDGPVTIAIDSKNKE